MRQQLSIHIPSDLSCSDKSQSVSPLPRYPSPATIRVDRRRLSTSTRHGATVSLVSCVHESRSVAALVTLASLERTVTSVKETSAPCSHCMGRIDCPQVDSQCPAASINIPPAITEMCLYKEHFVSINIAVCCHATQPPCARHVVYSCSHCKVTREKRQRSNMSQ